VNSPPVLLVIGKVWPEPQSSAAGWRILQIIAAFKNSGYKIHFGSVAKQGPFSADLKSLDIQEDYLQLNDPSFNAYIQQLAPEIVLFDRFTSEEQFGWRIKEYSPETIQILDTEDLHGLRDARELAYKQGQMMTNADLQSPLLLRELSSIYRCDLSLMISAFEMDLLQTVCQVPASLLHYLPLLSDVETVDDKDFEARQHFISLGNFLHAPNLNSVEVLYRDIWPGIRKALPNAQMHIYGAYTPDRIKQLHQPAKGFLIMDRAKDAREVMAKARVCLAPLQFGAGQKGKLLLAMECGTPSVTTPIGAEGMQQEEVWPGFVADNNASFIAAAIDLYSDLSQWTTAQQEASRLLKQYRSAEHLQGFKEQLLHLKTNIKEIRAANFTGALLRQNAMQTTRYMSLYIEAKNRGQK